MKGFIKIGRFFCKHYGNREKHYNFALRKNEDDPRSLDENK